MQPSSFCALARRLMSCPAAPFHETGVRDAVEAICAENGLRCQRDRFGNLLVELKSGRTQRPLALAAHMDHPGFSIRAPSGPGRWRAEFQGGVGDAYFRAGVPVRLMPGSLPATLGPRLGKPRHFELRERAKKPAKIAGASPPEFAVWELEDFAVRRGRIHGRSCDDLIGVATILATLIELKRRRQPVHVVGVIARAEEVGFLGALTVADARVLPADTLIISLETSKEIPPVKMGHGVIIRVGDKSSLFGSAATRFLTELAGEVAGRESGFQFQRALMSGGTCEATAYQEFGYEVAAVCVALGNYHNCGPRQRIAAEYVSVADACGMTRLLVEAAERMGDYPRLVARLPGRLHELLDGAKRLLLERSLP